MCDFENSLKLAESGNPIEQFQIGLYYYHGVSVSKDLKKAIKWFRASAEQGYIYAETSLGICYRKGDGILTNYIEAVKLFEHAAALGDITAIYNLAICYYYGQGVIKDYQKSAELFRQASEYGNVNAEHRWSHILSQVPAEPSSLEEALIALRKSRAVIDSLNVQLNNQSRDSDQAAFDNDSRKRQIAELEKELAQLKESLVHANTLTVQLKEEKERQRTTYEHTIEENQRISAENEKKLNEKISVLVCQSSEKSVQIKNLTNQVAHEKETVAKLCKTVEEQENSISNLNDDVATLCDKLHAANTSIVAGNNMIDNLRQQVASLKTQHPFIRKTNVLKAVDIFSFLLFIFLMLPIQIEWYPDLYLPIGILVMSIVVEVLSFVVLRKSKYGLHAFLRLFLTMGVTLLNFGYIYQDSDNLLACIPLIIPYLVINSWSAIASLMAEVYV